MKEAVKRTGIEPHLIDDVRFGCCMEPADALKKREGTMGLATLFGVGGISLACAMEML